MNKGKSRVEFAESIDRRLSGLQGDPRLAQRIIAKEEEKPMGKKISVSVVVVCILAAISVTAALAAGNLLPGLREMLGLDGNPDTEEMLQSVHCSWETEFAAAQIREMLYDGQGAYIAVDVHKTDRDDILLIPAADRKKTLNSSAVSLDMPDTAAGETIAEYAERKKQSVVYFSVTAHNPDKTFSAAVSPGDLTPIGKDSWTMVLRFPAMDQAEQIHVSLYTAVYNNPLAQASLPASSDEQPLAVPHGITVNVPDFINISGKKTVMNAVSVVENSDLTGLSIQAAKLIRTPIAAYVDLLIGNAGQTGYSTIFAEVTPLDLPDSEQYKTGRKHFGSPQSFSEGYASGAHEIELFPAEGFSCSAFQVDLFVLPMKSADEWAGTNHYKKAGSVTISFDISE